MKKPKYARAGEFVRIVVPKLFVRCGYPLTLDDVQEKFKEEVYKITGDCSEIIRAAMQGKLESGISLVALDHYTEKCLSKAVASAILRREGFGGRERIIVDAQVDALAGQQVLVTGRKTVITGRYSPASGGYSYDGDYDYDPAGLSNEKRHVIYEIEWENHTLLELPESVLRSSYPWKIQAENCELIRNA